MSQTIYNQINRTPNKTKATITTLDQPNSRPPMDLSHIYLLAGFFGDVHGRGHSRQPREVEAEARVIAQADSRAANVPAPLFVELAQRLLVGFGSPALCQPFQEGIAIPERERESRRDKVRTRKQNKTKSEY